MATSSQQALFAVLDAHAGVLGKVSHRIYQVEAPPNAQMPMLVIQLIATQQQTSHGEGTDARLDGAHFQITALGRTPIEAADALYQARLAIEASATLRGIQTDERSLDRSEEANCHARAADFLIWNNPDA